MHPSCFVFRILSTSRAFGQQELRLSYKNHSSERRFISFVRNFPKMCRAGGERNSCRVR